MKRILTSLAVLLVVLCLVLSIQAATCLAQQAAHGSTHHSPDHVGHSMLCAWGCLADAGTALASSSPVAVLVLIAFGTIAFHKMGWPAHPGWILPSRAPPR